MLTDRTLGVAAGGRAAVVSSLTYRKARAVGVSVGDLLKVTPARVQTVAEKLRAHHLTVAGHRRLCDEIEVPGADPATTIGVALESFTSLYGSALMALSRELDLLGVELGKSADAVVEVDHAGAR